MKKHNIGHPCLLAFTPCKEASRIVARLSKFDLLRFYKIIFVMNIRNLFIFYTPKLQMKYSKIVSRFWMSWFFLIFVSITDDDGNVIYNQTPCLQLQKSTPSVACGISISPILRAGPRQIVKFSIISTPRQE